MMIHLFCFVFTKKIALTKKKILGHAIDRLTSDRNRLDLSHRACLTHLQLI